MKSHPFAGTWYIEAMETWDKETFNEEERAFIKINQDKSGEFHFCYVWAEMDGRITNCGGEERFEFTFDGNDEIDSCQGRGWIKIKKDNMDRAEGELFFHGGDSSTFMAKRSKK